jgi:dipeptidyl-peptidase-3
MKNLLIILTGLTIMGLTNCDNQKQTAHSNSDNDTFNYFVEQFADIKILRYQVPGFNNLSLKEKKLAYFLSEAALCGRDILYDQFYQHNLAVRNTLESIYKGYQGNRDTKEFKQFETYLKRVWFSNGIHHHYSTDKFFPEFSKAYFKELVNNTKNQEFPLQSGETLNDFFNRLIPIMFDPKIASKRVNKDPEKGLLTGSATNFYENVTAKEAMAYYEKQKAPNDSTPIEYGHNTKLLKKDGELKEKTWKTGGMYSPAIEKIVSWLQKAENVAATEQQEEVIQNLISFYQTGDLEQWDKFNISWVNDTNTPVDFINGFVEVYNDPLNLKGTWESVVEIIDKNATKRMKTLSRNAQWFENHSPVADQFKKENVTGVTGKVINVVQLGGDVYPYSPIGINLPNSDWIRKNHGSKSVTLNNIINSHYKGSMESGMLEEFAYSEEEIKLSKEHGLKAHNLHVDMHEVLGHGSGQLLPDVTSHDLKNFHSTIEEARADLFAMYFIMDDKLIELGLMPNKDVAKAAYNAYIRSGLMTQLTRIEKGKNLEEAHMRNRQLISKWVYENGLSDSVITKENKNGKTYFVVHDHQKLRELFGELLAKVQRIKSEGNYQAAKQLIEKYGIEVDEALHKEVLARYEALDLAPYTGFINPELKPVKQNGEIVDVEIEYPQNYTKQMLRYSKDYSFLPVDN